VYPIRKIGEKYLLFTSVIEGKVNQADWKEVVVVNPMRKTDLLPGWEEELFPGGHGVW